jgi:demethylmenaquinone methyltransferase/2-methoxy-6-polyprenyl-1,4-benzoquinol methylase
MQSIDASRPRTPQSIFDGVAPYYDALNAILSFGLDRRWRRQTVAALRLRPGSSVLDVATGTGSLAAEIVRSTSAAVSVTGCDLNERMLSVARRRTRRASVEFVRCDATHLPFRDGAFDVVTIAFAIDDMPDREACVDEMWRVLRPGGQLALLELSQPDEGSLRLAYRLYLRTFRALRHFSVDGYSHLEQEILKYRGARATEELIVRGGFAQYQTKSLTWGIARLHVAEKASRSTRRGGA